MYKAWQKISAELLGTAGLLMVVVGSGIMADKLSQGNTALALLANALATGCGLLVLINLFASISGAHFNPVVSMWAYLQKNLRGALLLSFVAAQILGGVLGVYLAHLMFDLPILQISTTPRTGISQWAAEIIATTGLLMTIGLSSQENKNTPILVAAYITAAYWFTASTSFANPAVTLARSLTDTFAGIAPTHVLGFVLAQIVGLALAVLLLKAFKPTTH